VGLVVASRLLMSLSYPMAEYHKLPFKQIFFRF
jgi:hypothetical protein